MNFRRGGKLGKTLTKLAATSRGRGTTRPERSLWEVSTSGKFAKLETGKSGREGRSLETNRPSWNGLMRTILEHDRRNKRYNQGSPSPPPKPHPHPTPDDWDLPYGKGVNLRGCPP